MATKKTHALSFAPDNFPLMGLAAVYAPGTINRSLGALRKALADAWERDETSVDYSSLVKAVPDAHRARKVTLSLEEVKLLADCASRNTRVAMWCSLFTGCRRRTQRRSFGSHATLVGGNRQPRALPTRAAAVLGVARRDAILKGPRMAALTYL